MNGEDLTFLTLYKAMNACSTENLTAKRIYVVVPTYLTETVAINLQSCPVSKNYMSVIMSTNLCRSVVKNGLCNLCS